MSIEDVSDLRISWFRLEAGSIVASGSRSFRFFVVIARCLLFPGVARLSLAELGLTLMSRGHASSTRCRLY